MGDEPWLRIDFVCNVCGSENRRIPLPRVENRECPSCEKCGSSLRMRSLMYLLSMEIFGRPLTVPEFPRDKSIVGLGLSDWEGYANRLAHCFSYTNTFFHRPPTLDITVPDASLGGRYSFIIASDVYEHIPVGGLERAFSSAYDLLAPDGFMLFTVPFFKTGSTIEHFPRLHDYRIESSNGVSVLHNKTVDGIDEIYSDLVFHGGDGSTLEMRHFSEPHLRRLFAGAGFSSLGLRIDRYPLFGVIWPMDWAVPMVARKSIFSRRTFRRLGRLVRLHSA